MPTLSYLPLALYLCISLAFYTLIRFLAHRVFSAKPSKAAFIQLGTSFDTVKQTAVKWRVRLLLRSPRRRSPAHHCTLLFAIFDVNTVPLMLYVAQSSCHTRRQQTGGDTPTPAPAPSRPHPPWYFYKQASNAVLFYGPMR